jgi:ABC-2 type transport system permease protein
MAMREVTTRLQQKGFRIGLAVALLVVVAACVVPALFRGHSGTSTERIGLADSPPGLERALAVVAAAEHVHIEAHPSTVPQAQSMVRSGTWDAAVLPGGELLVKRSSDAVVTAVQQAYRLAGTVENLTQAGLTQTQAGQALTVTPLRVVATTSPVDNQRKAIAVIAVIALFSQLSIFCMWIATGVVEEKSSRVVELVLSSVRPAQLLTAKLLGIGSLAAAQVLAMAVAGLVAGSAAHTLTVPASAISVIAVSFVGFLLAFAFFAALAAGLASTVSRQEEVSGVMAPVTVLMTISYVVSLTTASSGSSAAHVLSMIPPISALSMPARIARGPVPLIDIVLAVLFLLAATVVAVTVAARVYRASVLLTGTRVSLRRAWRGEAVADLA